MSSKSKGAKPAAVGAVDAVVAQQEDTRCRPRFHADVFQSDDGGEATEIVLLERLVIYQEDAFPTGAHFLSAVQSGV